MNFSARLCGCLSILMLLLSACSGGGGGGGTHGGNGPVPPPPGGPVLKADLTSIDLTSILTDSNSNKKQAVTLTNISSGPLTISSIALTPPLSVDMGTCASSLASGVSCTYTVIFTFPTDRTKSFSANQNVNIAYTYNEKNASVSLTAVQYGLLPSPPETEIAAFINKGPHENSNPKYNPIGSSDVNTLEIDGMYDPNASYSGVNGKNFKAPYGFSGAVVLYNISGSAINFPTPVPDPSHHGHNILPVSITGSDPSVTDLSINVRSCGDAFNNSYNKTKNGLSIKGICAFEVTYVPTKDTSNSLKDATLNLKYISNTTNKETLVQFKIKYGTTKTPPVMNTNKESYQNFVKNTFLPTTNKLAVYNNCKEDVWIENKAMPDSSRIKLDPTPIGPIPSGSGINYDEKLLPYIYAKNGLDKTNYNFHNGLASFNMFAKFRCDSSGENCDIGQVLNNVACPKDGCQPDNGTKFEASFGCDDTRPKGSSCAVNPSDDKPLIGATFVDGSFVDGFSYNIAVDTFYTDSEDNPGCFSNAESQLSSSQCPTADNLTATADRWAVQDSTDSRWSWTDSQPPLGWSADEIGIIAQIGYTVWTAGITNIQSTLKGWSNPTFPICIEKDGNSGICTAGTAPVFPNDGSLNVLCSDWKSDGSNPDRNPKTILPINSLPLSLSYQNTIKNKTVNLGCAAPGRYLSTPRAFNGIGLGSDCVYVGSLFSSATTDPSAYPNFPKSAYWYSRYVDRPSNYSQDCSHDAEGNPDGIKNCLVPNSSSGVYSPDFNNSRIMFANPFGNLDLIDGPDNKHSLELNSPSAFVYKALVNFCSNNQAFCKYPGNFNSSGLANIVASMGPVSRTEYVQNVKAHGGGNYSWQYDDYSATRVCNAADTKFVVILCGKSDGSRNAFPLSGTYQSANKKLKTISKRLP